MPNSPLTSHRFVDFHELGHPFFGYKDSVGDLKNVVMYNVGYAEPDEQTDTSILVNGEFSLVTQRTLRLLDLEADKFSSPGARGFVIQHEGLALMGYDLSGLENLPDLTIDDVVEVIIPILTQIILSEGIHLARDLYGEVERNL